MMPISAWTEPWPRPAWTCPAAPPVYGRRRSASPRCSPCPQAAPPLPRPPHRPHVTPTPPVHRRPHADTPPNRKPPRDPPLTSGCTAAVPILSPRFPSSSWGATPARRRAVSTGSTRCPPATGTPHHHLAVRQCHDAPFLSSAACFPSTAVPDGYTDDAKIGRAHV